MKKIILLMLMLPLVTAQHTDIADEVNTYLSDNSVDLELEFLATLDSVSFSNNVLSLQESSRELRIEFSSFVSNKGILHDLDDGYRPTKMIIGVEEGSPVVILANDTDLVKVVGIDESRVTTIYFGGREFDELSDNILDGSFSRVLITRHYHPDTPLSDPSRTDGMARLAAVSNNLAQLKIENSIAAKSEDDNTIKLAVDTLLKHGTTELAPYREVDFLYDNGVVELFTQPVSGAVNLFVRFFRVIALDANRDRSYRVDEASIEEIPIVYDKDEEWTDSLPENYNLEQDCEEDTLCKSVYENTGDDLINCFCTKVNGVYGYRNQENVWCNIPKNRDGYCDSDNICAPYECGDDEQDPDCSYELTDQDYTYDCCDGTRSCEIEPPEQNETNETNLTGGCTKMGFMVIPGLGDVSKNLQSIKEFTGEGGTVLLVYLVNGEGALETTVAGLNAASSKDLKAVVRLLGPDWDKSEPPTPESLADTVIALKGQAPLQYVQVWNEPNVQYDGGTSYFSNPSTYAQYVIDFNNALDSKGGTDIKVVSAAMSGGDAVAFAGGTRQSGYDYSETVLNTPGFLDAIDYFAYHAYDIQSPKQEQGRTDTDVQIPEYGDKVWGEGILGYRYYVNMIKKISGGTKPMFLTEFGYREINTKREQGSPDYQTIKANMIEAIQLVQADPYVEGAHIFLLNGLIGEWYGDSWVDIDSNPLPHLTEISDELGCGGYVGDDDDTGDDDDDECELPPANREFEKECDDRTEFRFMSCTEGISVEDASDECVWDAVWKPITCNELDSSDFLDEGFIYARVYNEDNLPITSEIRVKLDEQYQYTGRIAYYPTCGDEVEDGDNARAGFVVFEFRDDVDTQSLYIETDTPDYDFGSDKVIFDESYPMSECGDSSKMASVYVRFHKRCQD